MKKSAILLKLMSPDILEVLGMHSSEVYFYSFLLSRFAFCKSEVQLIRFVTGHTKPQEWDSSAALGIIVAVVPTVLIVHSSGK